MIASPYFYFYFISNINNINNNNINNNININSNNNLAINESGWVGYEEGVIHRGWRPRLITPSYESWIH